MVTTTDEAKILEAARKQAPDHDNRSNTVRLICLILVVMAASMIILEQVLQLVGVLPNEHKALATIAHGLTLMGFAGILYEYNQEIYVTLESGELRFAGILYEYNRFRYTALSLIKKLTEEGTRA